ncbi:protein turtle homolog B-like [Ctenocephalides felis]|uniref:protein turtle homolog B-like n=1 Tax=Ctenocephalides felis TaxID=7515 RepID=UPI000E6E1407|nr:protein turtle homolog B-like [Ctenocephalides felis]
MTDTQLDWYTDYSWRHRRSHIHGSSEDKANSIIGVGKTNHAFLTPNGTRVQAQSGGSATLPCTLKRSSQGTVTWIRRSDFHLLTVGNAIYSSDERFHIEHVRHLGHWPLKIKSVKLEDAGTYECQISTHPPASMFVHLEVVEAFAEIQGSPDLHIRSGSTLRLVCSIKGAIERPSYVFWYHSGRMVNYDIDLGFIVRDEKDVSLLTVPEANKSMHDGNYTCAPSNARPASIAVHILNGEMPAAMQHANTSSGSSRNLSSYKITISIFHKLSVLIYHKIQPRISDSGPQVRLI